MEGGDSEKPATTRRLLEYLKDRCLLLVLGNLEHLPARSDVPIAAGEPSATQLIVTMLLSAPEISLLVNSRKRLNLCLEQALAI